MCGTTARAMLKTPPTLVSSTSSTILSVLHSPGKLVVANNAGIARRSDVDATRPVNHGIHRRDAGLGVAHVNLHGRDVRARRHNLGRRRGIAAIEEGNVDSFGCEQFHNRAPDAAAATGNDGNLSGQTRIDFHQPDMQKPPSTTSV